ncbi:putative Uncharacterized 50.6 kDa protein in the 5'region of gyrA and gyrB [Burkholderia vietnamiensis]|nr:putative Uncharacterized 50.6 kDa protein in the 5'region of gyrA and gyrB [Burkholderia vietnamiensis]
MRTEAGRRRRQQDRQPEDQVRDRPRVLGLDDSRLRHLRERRHRDGHAVGHCAAADRRQEASLHLPHDRPRRSARPGRRALHHQQREAEEGRDPARQAVVRPGHRIVGEEGPRSREDPRRAVRRHQRRRFGLLGGHHEAEVARRRFRLLRRLPPGNGPADAPGARAGREGHVHGPRRRGQQGRDRDRRPGVGRHAGHAAGRLLGRPGQRGPREGVRRQEARRERPVPDARIRSGEDHRRFDRGREDDRPDEGGRVHAQDDVRHADRQGRVRRPGRPEGVQVRRLHVAQGRDEDRRQVTTQYPPAHPPRPASGRGGVRIGRALAAHRPDARRRAARDTPCIARGPTPRSGGGPRPTPTGASRT